MTKLSAALIEQVLDEVEVLYLDRKRAKWWNDRRDADEPLVFCGWYWSKGIREAGPFKTYSSACVNAHYTFIVKRQQPAFMRPNINKLPKIKHAA